MPTLIFGCDGVLADTERYGHLPAYNQTFAEFFVPVHWSDADYAEKLLIGGGAERMLSVLTPDLCHLLGLDPMSPHFTAARAAMIARWHERKTQIYTEWVVAGDLHARPGVFRLAREADAAGWRLAVVSTAAAASVGAVLERAVGPDLAARFTIVAGDTLAVSRPLPTIYRSALDALGANNGGLNPNNVVVVEHGATGLRSALAAGLRTLVTVSEYTVNENYAGAALVVTSLGEPDAAETITLADPYRLRPGISVDLGVLESILTLTPSAAPQLDPASEVEL